VPASASGEHVAAAVLAAAASHRWDDGPPSLPSWDDCAASLLDVYRGLGPR
jgi:hypothetical protein